jgi:hypothetical protein
MCIPDKIIDGPDGVWVVERKTTTRDDAGWLNQWRLNFQTTMEVLVAEAYYKTPIQGVLIEQTLVTRRRVKDWPKGLPQDILKLEIQPPKPVPKEPFVKEEGKRFITDTIAELSWRHQKAHQWAANYANCPRCPLSPICNGKATAENLLVPIEPPNDC